MTIGPKQVDWLPQECYDRNASARKNATINWVLKESARAKLMVIVRRTLNKYGYPPDKQQKAIDTVLKQAEVLGGYWVEL